MRLRSLLFQLLSLSLALLPIELFDVIQTLIRRHLGSSVSLYREVVMRPHRPMGRCIPDEIGRAISARADDDSR